MLVGAGGPGVVQNVLKTKVEGVRGIRYGFIVLVPVKRQEAQ